MIMLGLCGTTDLALKLAFLFVKKKPVSCRVHFFYKNNFIRTRGSFCSEFKNNSASAKEQSLKFSVKVVNKKLQQVPHN